MSFQGSVIIGFCCLTRRGFDCWSGNSIWEGTSPSGAAVLEAPTRHQQGCAWWLRQVQELQLSCQVCLSVFHFSVHSLCLTAPGPIFRVVLQLQSYVPPYLKQKSIECKARFSKIPKWIYCFRILNFSQTGACADVRSSNCAFSMAPFSWNVDP